MHMCIPHVYGMCIACMHRLDLSGGLNDKGVFVSNGIGPRGAHALATALSACLPLTSLCLYGNELGDAGARQSQSRMH